MASLTLPAGGPHANQKAAGTAVRGAPAARGSTSTCGGANARCMPTAAASAGTAAAAPGTGDVGKAGAGALGAAMVSWRSPPEQPLLHSVRPECVRRSKTQRTVRLHSRHSSPTPLGTSRSASSTDSAQRGQIQLGCHAAMPASRRMGIGAQRMARVGKSTNCSKPLRSVYDCSTNRGLA